jgi:hypothetical protein
MTIPNFVCKSCAVGKKIGCTCIFRCKNHNTNLIVWELVSRPIIRKTRNYRYQTRARTRYKITTPNGIDRASKSSWIWNWALQGLELNWQFFSIVSWQSNHSGSSSSKAMYSDDTRCHAGMGWGLPKNLAGRVTISCCFGWLFFFFFFAT